MRYVRLFNDADGESHFEDVDVEAFAAPIIENGRAGMVSRPQEVSKLIFVGPASSEPDPDGAEREPGFHPTPTRRWAVGLSGRVALTASDGERRELHPGVAVFLEDTTGRGHMTTPLTPDVSFLMILE